MIASRTDTLLSIEGVSLSFGDRLVLRGINAKIDDLRIDGYCAGQVVAFLGRSGAGKSVLLRILAGLSKPTSGSVYVTSKRQPVRAGSVGMVMQDSPLFRHRTVFSNLMVAAKQHGYTSVDAKEKVGELLGEFDLSDSASKYPAELSGGMRQRVAICQQILCSDHYLLLDEPFSALDPVNVQRTCSLITRVANQDETNCVIVVTHDARAALAVADTVWILGRQKDEAGKHIPGSTIIRQMDLVAAGICWHPELVTTKLFQEVEAEIVGMFGDL